MGCVCDKVEFRKKGNKHDTAKYIDEVPKLAESQRNVIKRGWQILSQDLGNIGVLTFVRYVLNKCTVDSRYLDLGYLE